MAKHKVLHRVLTLVSAVIFIGALYIIYRVLETHPWSDIVQTFTSLSPWAIAEAVVLTALSYIILMGYDLSALHYVGREVRLRRVAFASFISYAFANNMGLAIVTGGSVRFRVYTAAGLSAAEVATVIGFCAVTFGIGATVLGAVVMLFYPSVLSNALDIPRYYIYGLSLIVLMGMAAYLFYTMVRKHPVRIWRWKIRLPSARFTLVQIALASADLACAAGVLYALMPHDVLSYPVCLAVFVLATTAGILSHVPGGLGVFETTILLFVPQMSPSVLLGVLVAFRLIYLILPLFVAALILGMNEIAKALRNGRRA